MAFESKKEKISKVLQKRLKTLSPKRSEGEKAGRPSGKTKFPYQFTLNPKIGISWIESQKHQDIVVHLPSLMSGLNSIKNKYHDFNVYINRYKKPILKSLF